jgi:hypothetical protein
MVLLMISILILSSRTTATTCMKMMIMTTMSSIMVRGDTATTNIIENETVRTTNKSDKIEQLEVMVETETKPDLDLSHRNSNNNNGRSDHQQRMSRSDRLQEQFRTMLFDMPSWTTTAKFRIALHFNGDPTVWGNIDISNSTTAGAGMTDGDDNEHEFDMDNKYHFEAAFTEYVASYSTANHCKNSSRTTSTITSPSNGDRTNCPPEDVDTRLEVVKDDATDRAPFDLLNYCDMGPNRTVVQRDSHRLVRVRNQFGNVTLPCRWYSREGVRIVSMQHFQLVLLAQIDSNAADDNNDNITSTAPHAVTVESDGTTRLHSNHDGSDLPTDIVETFTFHVYAVPAGRVFMFAPSSVGETFRLDHIVLPPPPPTTTMSNHDENETDHQQREQIMSSSNIVSLEVLSLEPRIFDIHHFFSAEESRQLVEKATSETSETHKFHRSMTGTTSSSIYSQRTSENAWDTHGTTALLIKR